MKQVAVLMFVFCLALTACGEEGTQEAEESAGPQEYAMQVEAELAGGQIKVSSTTNLPDGARVSVKAVRIFRNEGEDEVRASPVDLEGEGSLEDAEVRDGSFNATIPLEESTLTLGVGPAQDDDTIAVVDSHLTVCATFYTGRDAIDDEWRQPDADVRATVGESGEQLEGSPQAEEFGSATDTPSLSLETMTRIKAPVTVMDEIIQAQGSRPRVRELESFC